MSKPSSLLAASLLLASSSVLADPLPNFDAYASAPAVAPIEVAGVPAAFVAGRDAQRGVPTLLLAPHATSLAASPALGSPEAAARFWLLQHAPRYGMSASALESVALRRIVDTGRGGIVAVFGQQVNGVEVYRSEAKVLLDRRLQWVAIGGELQPTSARAGKSGPFKVAAPEAARRALADLYGFAPALLKLDRVQGASTFYGLSPSPSALRFLEPARVKQVYYALPDRLVPAYFVELFAQAQPGVAPDGYDYVIAADDGRLLHRENLAHSAFSYRVFADATGDKRPFDGPLQDFTPHPTGVPDGSYPAPATPNLVTIDGFNAPQDPWLAPGATVTQGNNVDAYTDDDSPDGFSSGDLRASVSGPGVFGFSYDFTLDPQANSTQKMAAVTDLFYVTNWLHDWWYDSGFTETTANAQQSNYGRGGLEADPLHAEAQDGAPTNRNNSNMYALSDGTSPRMQMYVWDGRVSASVSIQPLASNPTAGVAGFGPTNFNVTGSLVLADDGTNTVTDACEPITNAVSGKVVLVDRGTCSFKLKALHVQSAGGLAMLLVNNNPNTGAPPMGDDAQTTATITIPLLSISLADGNAIRAAMANAAQAATLVRTSAPSADGTLDNGVIAHEWGHYLHLRQVSCGNPQCAAQSEGWGDFTALQMILRQGDDLDGTYALAQYAIASDSSDAAYFGIRRFPYSVDTSKNPLTFADIADATALPTSAPINLAAAGAPNSEPHSAGEIWSTMLFEGFVSLLKDSQGATPRYTFDGARRRMSDYVELALQLAPADPTYTEQRDALLAAAAASDPQDAALLAQAFARRGAGSCAVSPARDSTNFAGVVEDFNVVPQLQLVSTRLDDSLASCDGDGVLDDGERGLLTVTVANSGGAPWSGAIDVATTATGVSFPSGSTLTFSSIGAGAQQSASVEVDLGGVTGSEQIALQLNASPAASCDGGTSWSSTELANYDLTASASDDVEASTTTWTPSGTDAQAIWSRQATANSTAWVAIDFASPSDTALVSPALQVGSGAPLVVDFDARYQFETSNGVFWDGAVIELSTDDGATWSDASTYGTVPYGGTIGDPQNQATNALKGRSGLVGQNPSWPNRDHVTLNLGTSLAGESVRLRFRIGTDDSTGAAGLELDNFVVGGITNPPFTAIGANAGVCVAPIDGGSTTDAGADDGGAPDAGTDLDAGAATTASTGTSGSTGSTSATTGSTGTGSTSATSGSTGGGTTSSVTTGTSGTSSTGSGTTTTTGATSTSGSSGGASTGSGSGGASGGTKPTAAGGGCGCLAGGDAGLGSGALFAAFALVFLGRAKRSRLG